MRSQKSREVAWTGMLFALAIALSFLESAITPLLGLMPAMKLGLSNLVVMYALLFLNTRTAAELVLLKALFALLTRGPTAGFLSLCGGVTAFTDYRIEQIEDAVVPYLSDDDWAEAASEYLSMCADTLDFYAEHGEPLDVDNDTSGWPILLLIVIGVPMIIAGIVCGVLYSQMKTARLKTEANDYIGAGLKLRVQVDNYTHTDRVQVYDPPHEESSSSGGSSVDSDGFGGSSGGSF